MSGFRCALITGASGFIGGRIVERLVLESARCEIRALVKDLTRVSRIARFRGAHIVQGDVLDLSRMIDHTRGCDVIFHCAYGNRADGAERRVTVEGTRTICEAALRNGSKLIHLSTVSVYGPTPPVTVDEGTPFRPGRDLYSTTKLEAEKIVADYIGAKSLPAVIIRPTVVYGPYSPVWTLNPIHQLKRGAFLLIDHGQGTCNHLYIDNLIDALFKAAVVEGAAGQDFIISDASTHTWKEFFSYYRNMLEAHGEHVDWVSIGKPELLAIAQQRRQVVHNLRGIARTLITNESLHVELGKYHVVREVKGFVKRMLPQTATEAIRDFRGPAATGGRPPADQKDIDLPAPRDLEAFSSTSTFSIRKAAQTLGYNGAIDLQAGMDLVGAWYRTLF